VKLVHVTTIYPGYIADFERRHPEVAGMSFGQHRAALYRDAFGLSDYFVRHLEALGHQGLHLVANYSAIQMKWARENGFKPTPGQAMFSIVQAQVRAVRPELLVVEDCYAFPAAKTRLLAESAGSVRAVACFHGLDDDIRPLVPREALLIGCAPTLVKHWRELGYRTALVRHAFEPAVLETLSPPMEQSPLTFVGACSPLLHPDRHALLRAMARAFPELEVWTGSFNIRAKPLARITLSSLARARVRRVWSHFFSPLRRQVRGELYGVTMLGKLRDSLITLNHHIGLSRPTAGNMRLFEATGTGACLVTDAKRDLDAIFEPETEVVTYSSTMECIEKVRWLLDHPVQAQEIAQRGQRRTLRDHTFANRAYQLEELFSEHLRAPARTSI
jgi:spore maturation protein CgeB